MPAYRRFVLAFSSLPPLGATRFEVSEDDLLSWSARSALLLVRSHNKRAFGPNNNGMNRMIEAKSFFQTLHGDAMRGHMMACYWLSKL
jgi:hypothetical protein